jgi:glutamate synthase (NADPH/NADH) large chain
MDALTAFKDNCGFGLLANIKNIPSYKNTDDAITALSRMIHRGAIAADGKSADGSGLLFSMPDKFMKKIAKENQIDLPELYAVGMLFLTDEKQKKVIEETCEKNDLKALAFRSVPVDTSVLGKFALESLPDITQVFIVPNSIIATKRFDALLYLTRKEIEHKLKDEKGFYIPSFSRSVISYKGLVIPTYIKEFYKDLQDGDFQVSFALFHQRFSTNTLPEWKLAQPFRAVAHNGEINSIEANRYNVAAKSKGLKSDVFSDEELERILPILQTGSSDSASLDNMLEFLLVNGLDFFKAARNLIPAPWQNAPHMDGKLRAFYEYTSTCFEAWDGPAAVSMTDGRYIGCVLDRNGLRPAKYIITNDDRIIISSEYGVIDLEAHEIHERGRLQSGEMIGIDLKYGKILKNTAIDEYMKSSQPYGDWLNENMHYLQEYVTKPLENTEDYEYENLIQMQRFHNVTNEVIESVIKPMAEHGKENTASMGDDTPLAAFSEKQRNFTDFFKQKFAQVTNPPIDPLRESVVMSTNTGFGQIHNILDEKADHTKRLKAITPVLFWEKLETLLSFGDENNPRYDSDYKYRTYYTGFKSDLQASLTSLAETVIDDVKNDGIRTIVLDDRILDKETKLMPMAMVIGHLNEAMLKAGVRHLTSTVAISGELLDPHSVAVMLGYGVNAVYPYLLYATVMNVYTDDTPKARKAKLKNIQQGLSLGILKIMSKMGISTVASYRNSALFDVIGLSKEIVESCFSSSTCLMSGLGFSDIEERIVRDHKDAFVSNHLNRLFPLEIGSFYKYNVGGEYHDFAPTVVHAMHNAAVSGNKEDYAEVQKLIDQRGLRMIRDFFDLKSDRKPIDVSKVEAKDEIFKRFASAAMSMGSISEEAHEALAEAMNRLGGMSNSGEGGEKPERLNSIKNSKIKQVASGRFGVTPAYLRSAEEIQIKVAQGAKPGEGGQLPGEKVTPLIASLRYTIPGVTLISPPPHHDIYSIEDLAQLIYDMKQVNPKATISVKLVSTAGVGTIAAGVAKAYADKIIISGADGGTGAAPQSSIKFTGNPWEIGLTEAHDALKANELREMVHLQTDGGLKTGLDVVKAAILGAESYGFGTGLLVILGCKILRVCHLNRCTVGIATQDENLRAHYVGTVERVMNYLTLIAEDVREILAGLGYTSLEEIIGKRELLEVVDDAFAKKFDFSSILRRIDGVNTCQVESNEPFDDNSFEKEILKELRPTIKNPNEKAVIDAEIKNVNRSFGALVSGEVAHFYGDKGLEKDTIKLNLTGVAGQALGAFLHKGITINIKGVANDYVGKGMHGGKITIIPAVQGEQFSAAGNTCLYGATGGELYVAGSVGERFGVRNSGAIAVVEGTGDHACEYMTGGAVVILGPTGINFGAGMTGGVAFIYDSESKFYDKMNQELVKAIRVDTDFEEEGKQYLKKLLKNFYNETGSIKAKAILDDFRQEVRNFWMVIPKNMKFTIVQE